MEISTWVLTFIFCRIPGFYLNTRQNHPDLRGPSSASDQEPHSNLSTFPNSRPYLTLRGFVIIIYTVSMH